MALIFLIVFIAGIKSKSLDFASWVEQYTTNTVNQYVDTISKLQARVRELETERDKWRALAEGNNASSTTTEVCPLIRIIVSFLIVWLEIYK